MNRKYDAISEFRDTGIAGIIPDFFHDVIAYLIPGYAAVIITVVVWGTIQGNIINHLEYINNLDVTGFFAATIISYVAGRFFEHVGYKCIHKGNFIFSSNEIGPKWRLLFDTNNDGYTDTFKENLVTKIGEWLYAQKGKALMDDCKKNHKDDYFNLIQFYLRDRFPQVALYEKKQNATIVMTRSLSVIFFLSTIPLIAYAIGCLCSGSDVSTVIILLSVVFAMSSWVFYNRFKLDRQYHAMYIFESFIATKKLLKTKSSNCNRSFRRNSRVNP